MVVSQGRDPDTKDQVPTPPFPLERYFLIGCLLQTLVLIFGCAPKFTEALRPNKTRQTLPLKDSGASGGGQRALVNEHATNSDAGGPRTE